MLPFASDLDLAHPPVPAPSQRAVWYRKQKQRFHPSTSTRPPHAARATLNLTYTLPPTTPHPIDHTHHTIMAYHGALATPGGETRTDSSVDYSNPNFGSGIESFQSPGDDHNILRGGAAASKRRSNNTQTPSRPAFGSITNQRGNRNEFTPLLKSVHRSAMKSKLEVPAYLRSGASGRSPQLPMASAVDDDTTFRSSGEEDTVSGPVKLPDSSVNSTPLAALRGGGGGPLGADGQLTLREQEKVIDDIKKENFGLKLKVFFLNERLDKLGPEFNDAAIKEVGSPLGVRADFSLLFYAGVGEADGCDRTLILRSSARL